MQLCNKCGETLDESFFTSPFRNKMCRTCEICRAKIRKSSKIAPTIYPDNVMAQVQKCNKCRQTFDNTHFLNKKTNMILKTCLECRQREICEHLISKYRCKICRRPQITIREFFERVKRYMKINDAAELDVLDTELCCTIRMFREHLQSMLGDDLHFADYGITWKIGFIQDVYEKDISIYTVLNRLCYHNIVVVRLI